MTAGGLQAAPSTGEEPGSAAADDVEGSNAENTAPGKLLVLGTRHKCLITLYCCHL